MNRKINYLHVRRNRKEWQPVSFGYLFFSIKDNRVRDFDDIAQSIFFFLIIEWMLIGTVLIPLLGDLGIAIAAVAAVTGLAVVLIYDAITSRYFRPPFIDEIGKDGRPVWLERSELLELKEWLKHRQWREKPEMGEKPKQEPLILEFIRSLNDFEYQFLIVPGGVKWLTSEQDENMLRGYTQQEIAKLVAFRGRFKLAMLEKPSIEERMGLCKLRAQGEHIIPKLEKLIKENCTLNEFKANFKLSLIMVDYKFSQDNTLAHLAAAKNRKDIVEFLESRGANPALQNKEGKTARDILNENTPKVAANSVAILFSIFSKPPVLQQAGKTVDPTPDSALEEIPPQANQGLLLDEVPQKPQTP